MKLALIVLAVIVGLLLLLEIGLRLFFGFGNPLIYLPDEQIGYLLAPNQQTRRFGNRIEINQYSMRSPAITATRSDSTLRILLIGDSIANGGWWTDQKQILSSLLMRELQPMGGNAFPQVEVLNASANSWSPRNELAYLQRFGTFESQAVVLLINTDDLFGTAPTSVPVGRDINYPQHKPPLALVEAFSRYILPAPSVPEMAAVNAEAGDRVGFNLEAIGKIQTLTQQANAQFILAMTPLVREIGEPGSRDYEVKARQRLLEFTQTQQITYIDFLPLFKQSQAPEALFRDNIHLSPQGNELVSATITRSLEKLLPLQNLSPRVTEPNQ